MTELEWLKEQSGLSDVELKAMEAVAGSTKFVAMLQKIMASNESAQADKTAAEKSRLDFEKRYQEEFIPEMRKVTQDSLRAQGELAAAQARLKAAQEYGIVPEVAATPAVDPPRAPGSPDPNMMTRDDFGRFSQSQSNTIIALNDLNAEHFRLFGQPLGGTQELVDEVTKQRTLGNKAYTLKQAWESKHNVEAKRTEIAAAAKQKEKDDWTKEVLKTEREKNGSNPNLRTGVTSRFSTISSAASSTGGKEPWKASRSLNERNKPWRENAISKVREFVSA